MWVVACTAFAVGVGAGFVAGAMHAASAAVGRMADGFLSAYHQGRRDAGGDR